MRIMGTIHFPNDLSEERWNEIVTQFGLSPTKKVEMFAQVIGEEVTVQDPPNLLALFQGQKSDRPGIIRCSRMFFDGGIGETAEISFQGEGKDFEQLVGKLSEFVAGELTIHDPIN